MGLFIALGLGVGVGRCLTPLLHTIITSLVTHIGRTITFTTVQQKSLSQTTKTCPCVLVRVEHGLKVRPNIIDIWLV